LNAIQPVKRTLNNDKPWFPLLAMLLLCLLAPNTQAALLFYEGFDYSVGAELGETAPSGTCWENDKSQFTIVTGSLDYAGLNSSTGNRLSVASITPSLDSVRTTRGAWSVQSSGALYVSFLLKIDSTDGITTTGNGTSVLTLGRTSNNSHLFGVNLLDSDGIKLGVLKYSSGGEPVSSAFFSSGIGANLPVNGSTTCLVVAKYEWVDGPTNDVVTVWVNPQSLGASEDPNNKVSASVGADGTDPAGRLTLSRGPHLDIDEIRIGRTWADVTPTGVRTTASLSPDLETRPQGMSNFNR